jgi:hypothetical protein
MSELPRKTVGARIGISAQDYATLLRVTTRPDSRRHPVNGSKEGHDQRETQHPLYVTAVLQRQPTGGLRIP